MVVGNREDLWRTLRPIIGLTVERASPFRQGTRTRRGFMYWYGECYHTGSAIMDLGLEKNAQRTLIKTLDEMVPVFERLEAWMRFFGYPGRDKFAGHLALQEAVMNAIQHGNRGQHDTHVKVTYLVTPAEVLLQVEDQ